MATGMIACSAATELWQFYLLYGVIVPIGICSAGWSQFIPIIIRWFKKKRATALGFASAGFAISFLLSSLTAPLILYVGWRGTFVVLGLLPLLVIIPLTVVFVKNEPEDLAILSESVAVSNAPLTTRKSTIDSTITDAMRNYRFWLIFMIFFLMWGLGQSTIIAHQVAYIRDLGYNEIVGAVIVGLYGVVEVIGNLLSFIADRYRKDIVFTIGSLGLIFSVVLLMLNNGPESGVIMLYSYSILFGFFNGLVGPVMTAIPADFFQGRNFGGINGILMLGFGVGGALGPWLGGLLFDISGTYRMVFYMVISSFLVATFLTWLVTRQTTKKGEPKLQQ
jgi:MFS family permease